MENSQGRACSALGIDSHIFMYVVCCIIILFEWLQLDEELQIERSYDTEETH